MLPNQMLQNDDTLSARNICAHGSNRETNGGRRGILSNVIATGDIH